MIVDESSLHFCSTFIFAKHFFQLASSEVTLEKDESKREKRDIKDDEWGILVLKRLTNDIRFVFSYFRAAGLV